MGFRQGLRFRDTVGFEGIRRLRLREGEETEEGEGARVE